MAFPTGVTIPVSNVNDATDNPGDARADIKTTFDYIQDIVDSYDSASGIAALDAGGKLANTKLPDTIVSSAGTNLTLDPNTDIVKINNILELTPVTVATLTGLTGVEGQVAYCENGDSGSPCIAVYTGSNWKVVTITATNIST